MNVISDTAKQIVEMTGLKWDTLTEEQKSLLAQPYDAPEDYARDGEYSESENRRIWVSKLIDSGMDRHNIGRALRIVT